MYESGRVQQIENYNSPNKIEPNTRLMIPNLLKTRNVNTNKINDKIDNIKTGIINTIVGPYLIYKYKLNNKNIILVGEHHHKLPKILDYDEIYFMDLLKLQLLRDNNQCYDLFIEQKLKHINESWYETIDSFRGGYSKLFKGTNYKGIEDNEHSSLLNWLIDDDLVKCSSHYIPGNSNLPITEDCPFKNLRYHNVDLRLLCSNFYSKYQNKSKQNYLKLINILVNYNNKYSLKDFKNLISNKSNIKDYADDVWNLIRKEEEKLDKKLIKNESDLNRLKKIFLQKNIELSNFSDNYSNICGYMDYYAMLRIFVKYKEDRLNRNKTSKYGATPEKCRNIDSNENIIYYCGGYHTILIYKILNEFFNKYPVMFGYFDLNEDSSNIVNKVSLNNMEKYDGKITNLFEIFEM